MNIYVILSFITILVCFFLFKEKRKLEVRFKDVLDTEKEKKKVMKEIDSLEKEKKDIEKSIFSLKEEVEKEKNRTLQILEKKKELEKEINLLEEKSDLQEFSFYEPKFFYDTSDEYKEKIKLINLELKEMIKNNTAAKCRTEWQIDGSKKKGQKMTDQVLKMMLRAFNGEADTCIAKVKFNNIGTMQNRIKKAYETINKLNSSHQAYISDNYLKLKLEELYLNYEMAEKVQEEKEEQRAIREKMREEEKAQKEFEKELLRTKKEEEKTRKLLDETIKKMNEAHGEKIEEMQKMVEKLKLDLEKAEQSKQKAMSMAQQTKAGHVYVISNIGSFGEDVYKIGMTRRLEPMDRVKELGDASVPFSFDVHAMIYSENAPELENNLHKEFNEKRLNKINNRKEFFKVKLNEIEEISKKYNVKAIFTKLAEAKQYRETLMIEKQKKENELNNSENNNNEKDEIMKI